METFKKILFWLSIPYKIWRAIFDSIFIKYIDIFITRSLFNIFHLIHILNLHLRGLLEDYIINKRYSLLTQFERYYTDEALELMAFTMLGHEKEWTFPNIYEHFLEASRKAIYLSKRQCYNLKSICIRIKDILDKEQKEKWRAKSTHGGQVLFR